MSEGYECEKIAIEKIKHFVSKEAFNIDGLGKKIIENFWNLNLSNYHQDIFNLDYKKIEKLDGWGNLSFQILKYSMNEKKKFHLKDLFILLGIRHIGQENAKLIARHLNHLQIFLNYQK